MLIDINIVSYNRPHYLQILLKSLRKQNEGDYRIRKISLFQDGPNPNNLDYDKVKIVQCIQQFRKYFPDGDVYDNETNVGINGNYKALWNVAEKSDADAMIVFEDDLDLSPHYLNVMVKLLKEAERNPNIGFVSAVGMLGASAEKQAKRQKALMPMMGILGIHRWGWGVTRAYMREIIPMKKLYFDVAAKVEFLDNAIDGSQKEKLEKLWRFIADIGLAQPIIAGQIDALYDVVSIMTNRINLITYANYAIPIGEEGVHFDSQSFSGRGYRETVLAEDVPDEFDWYHPEMMLDMLTILTRFFSNFRATTFSGPYSDVRPFPQLQKAQLVRVLYDRILGWKFDVYDMVIHSVLGLPPGGYQGDLTTIVLKNDLKKALFGEIDETFGLLYFPERANRACKFPYGSE